MDYLLAVICSIVLLVLAQCMLFKRERLIVIIIFAVIYYFSIYTTVGGILFWIEEYSLGRCVLLTLAVSLLSSIVGVLKGDIKGIHFESTMRESWLSYICILFLCAVFSGFFGYFGMGQDQGVYQVEAINLLYGVTDKQQKITEYDELQAGEYKDFYQSQVQKQAGYDLLVSSDNIPGVKINAETSDTEGMWHGIPTFASILALSASIFGIDNMPFIGTIFFVCFLLIIEFILVNLKVDKFLRVLVLLVVGCSPEIIWVKKSTLTEGFLSLLIVAYIFFLVHSERKKSVMSVIPIIVYSFFHVTVFTMMPIFIINYWFLFLASSDKQYLHCAKIAVIGYILGFFMMFSVQPRYTLLNYQHGLSFLPLNIIPFVVIIACIIALGLTILLGKKVKESVDTEKYVRQYMRIISLIAITYVVLKPIMANYTYHEFTMITLVCYCVLSGILLLPAVFFSLIANKYEYNRDVGILLLTFSWCVVIYALIMRQDIQYYYYYGRYLVPYISVIAIVFACFGQRYLSQFRTIALIGVAALMPFASVFLTNQDDTKIQWSEFTEVLEIIDANNVVLLDENLIQLFYFPLKASSGVKVYPVINNSFFETIENIEVDDENIVYVSSNSIEKDNSWVEVVYRDISFLQEDNLLNISAIVGLPSDMPNKKQTEISIYRISNETKDITCLEDEHFVSGWAGRNDLGYRWMNCEEAIINGYLKMQDYTMTIHSGNNIPFNLISKERISVSVYINGEYLKKFTITAQTVGEDIRIVIPKEYIINGYNEIKFIGETWSPKEFGSGDKSNYCFSVDYIEFSEKEYQK